MKKYVFNIKQNFEGHLDDQNVWVLAASKEEARRQVAREYHSIVDITFIKVLNG